jgi:hypothetical protein
MSTIAINPSGDAAPVPEFYRLRKERNLFAAGAVVSIVVSIGGSLPHFLKKHNELKRLNDEIVSLQATIVANQSATREAQAAIVKTQQEIVQLQKH